VSLLILGLGNDLLGDDGIGLLAAQALEHSGGGSVTVTGSALSGLYLLDLIEGYDDLIVVDSVLGDHPGRVRRLSLEAFGPGVAPSAHYAGLADALAGARHAGMRVPSRVVVVGVEIGEGQTLGSAVSPQVLRGLPEVVRHVRRIARSWGHVLAGSVVAEVG